MAGGKGNICEAESIISRRKKNGVTQFLIRWKNYPVSDSTWEPIDNIIDESLISDFEKRIKEEEQRKPAKRGRSNSYQPGISKYERKTEPKKDSEWSVSYGEVQGKPEKRRKVSKDYKTVKPSQAKKKSIKSNSGSVNKDKTSVDLNNQHTENIPPDLMDLDTKYLDTFKQCNLNVEGAIDLKNENSMLGKTLPVGLDTWNKSSQFGDQQTAAAPNSDLNNEDDFLPSDLDSQDFGSDTSYIDVEQFENLTTSDIEAEENTQENGNLSSRTYINNKSGNAFTEKDTDFESLSDELISEDESLSSDGSDLDFIIKTPSTTNSIIGPPKIYRGILHRPICMQRNATSLQQLLDSGEDADDPNDPNIIILQPEYVLGLMMVEEELITMVKWKRINIVNAIPAKEMKQMYPELLIEYYECSIKFKR